jgi:hypothetical protein
MGLRGRDWVVHIKCCIISALHYILVSLHLPSDDKLYICRIVDRNVFPHEGLYVFLCQS